MDMEYNMTYEPADIIVHVQEKGIVLREKSLVAFRKKDGKCFAFGTEAERMAGIDQKDIVVMSPLRQGMVADFVVAEKLFSQLLIKAQGKKSILKPAVAVCVPKGITLVEKKAIEEVMICAGAKELFITDIPAAEFIGGFPEKYPKEYRKFKITIGITKDEPERYIEERLQALLDYAREEQISPERVCGWLKKMYP